MRPEFVTSKERLMAKSGEETNEKSTKKANNKTKQPNVTKRPNIQIPTSNLTPERKQQLEELSQLVKHEYTSTYSLCITVQLYSAS